MYQTNSNGSELHEEAEMKNVAIVGNSRVAASIMNNPDSLGESDVNVIGLIDLGFSVVADYGACTPRLLGHIEELDNIVRDNDLHKVFLAIDSHDIQKMHDVIQRCEQGNVDYEVLPSLDSFTSSANGTAAPATVVPAEEHISEFWLQRVIDFVVSLAMFALFLPSWIIVAIAIKLESRGPVFYSQERVGKDGKIFKIYKFRSMYTDAESAGPQLATRNDPRITLVGNILRKTRLDEVPQLMNVIRGDMSMIGPRPERPYFVEKYGAEIPQYKSRLRVKPGLTGIAQVETGYDESLEDVKAKLKHDLYYIENQRSVKLYLKIWLKTIWVVLTAKGQ